jgi:hypothetical protein
VIVVLWFTHARAELLQRTRDSWIANVSGFGVDHIVVDDSGDPGYAALLDERSGFNCIVHHESRRGFAGAIKSGWSQVCDRHEYVMHMEDDFTFNRPVDLDAMVETLEAHPNLVQIALQRQPWNAAESARGTIYQPDFEQHETPHPHIQHRAWFTTNPSVYRADLCRRGWPQVPRSEGIFTHQLLAEPAARFGYWGHLDDPPWVTHIGDDRAGGKGY